MIYLNVGSNLPLNFNEKLLNIKKNIENIKKRKISIIRLSSLYETPSYPNKSDPMFLNICLKVKSSIAPENLLKEFKTIESKMGRKTTKKNQARKCDIDIIDYNGMIVNNNLITLPHPRMHLRNFVIYPLREIEPNWSHPVFHEKIDIFFNNLNDISHNEITRVAKNDIFKL